jgi:phosphopantothenate-cysteine ligase
MVESETEPGSVKVDEKYQVQMLDVLRKYKQAQKDNTLLLLPFTTVTQYLFSLRCIALTMSKLHVDTRCVFYLAAAVSDFFMPTSRLPQHKIQSSGGELVVNLDPVPKFLKRLVEAWAPRVMIVSFKLETDESILESKAKTALERYNHQLVIGNLLQTRKKEVIFVTLEETEKYSLTDEEEKEGKEIEEIIVPEVIKRHDVWQEKVCN